MTPLQFIQIPAFCAALMLFACGGETDNASPPAEISSAAESNGFSFSSSSSTIWLLPPASSPRPMAGFDNLGATCHANAALKFLIHSTEPQRLIKHLIGVVAASDAVHREAAMRFIELIESSYSETGPTPQDLNDFLASLQKLPAFSLLDGNGNMNFPIVGQAQDANDFLMKLSESFALHPLHANTLALKDDANAFKTHEEYWTILRPASADDSLQDVFDRTIPASWQVTPSKDLRQLTVRMENAVDDAQGRRMLGNRNFDFNSAVLLKTTDGKRTTTLTLEPREVIEFVGADSTGHYIAYAKDTQWVRYDDAQVTVMDQMPAIENVRLINFVITKIASDFSSAS